MDWVQIDYDNLLLGCGKGYTKWSAEGKGKRKVGDRIPVLRGMANHQTYSIINLKSAGVVQKGEMSEFRIGY